MILGMDGNMSVSWKRSLPWTRRHQNPDVLPASGPAPPPPEDCGGVFGYLDLLEAIKDPHHPEHDGIIEWLGGDFDPEAFDIREVNQRLAGLKESTTPA